jgi:hypothetical protein
VTPALLLRQRDGINAKREPIQRPLCSNSLMTDTTSPFLHLSLDRAIALRWTLRDIKGRRLQISPAGGSDLKILTELGLIEMRDEVPVLTKAGQEAPGLIQQRCPICARRRLQALTFANAAFDNIPESIGDTGHAAQDHAVRFRARGHRDERERRRPPDAEPAWRDLRGEC